MLETGLFNDVCLPIAVQLEVFYLGLRDVYSKVKSFIKLVFLSNFADSNISKMASKHCVNWLVMHHTLSTVNRDLSLGNKRKSNSVFCMQMSVFLTYSYR